MLTNFLISYRLFLISCASTLMQGKDEGGKMKDEKKSIKAKG
jgi:hypothetical protein